MFAKWRIRQVLENLREDCEMRPQRLKPHLFRGPYVVAKATTHKHSLHFRQVLKRAMVARDFVVDKATTRMDCGSIATDLASKTFRTARAGF
jgi:hypothetical protein